MKPHTGAARRVALAGLVGLAGCSASLDPVTLDCARSIDAVDEIPPDYVNMLDVAAIVGPGTELQANDGAGDGPRARWFAKSGLLVAAGKASTIEVPPSMQQQLSIGWGGDRTWSLSVPACSGEATWLAFAGGFYVDEPACVEVVVRTEADAEARSEVGVGASCGG